ncbi:hypothetical protein DFH11DRAFT_1016847 [Phellopilus nigrolimitatus]|nr:hypothetical protein DFH11DRAFT_1016847 [Phellopilus nigrolimitatus]
MCCYREIACRHKRSSVEGRCRRRLGTRARLSAPACACRIASCRNVIETASAKAPTRSAPVRTQPAGTLSLRCCEAPSQLSNVGLQPTYSARLRRNFKCPPPAPAMSGGMPWVKVSAAIGGCTCPFSSPPSSSLLPSPFPIFLFLPPVPAPQLRRFHSLVSPCARSSPLPLFALRRPPFALLAEDKHAYTRLRLRFPAAASAVAPVPGFRFPARATLLPADLAPFPFFSTPPPCFLSHLARRGRG